MLLEVHLKFAGSAKGFVGYDEQVQDLPSPIELGSIGFYAVSFVGIFANSKWPTNSVTYIKLPIMPTKYTLSFFVCRTHINWLTTLTFFGAANPSVSISCTQNCD